MNINELLNHLVISEIYENQILMDNNIRNYINNEVFDSVFYTIVEFLNPLSVVRRKYIDGYGDQPAGCNRKNLVLFAPLEENTYNAINKKWIARMPLQQNNGNVIIYFPREIVVANDNILRFEDRPEKTKRFRYAIPKDINKFIENPSAYISLAAVQGRLNN
ncbi:MAG: hypothetical protein RLZZ66_649 [Pseudomonadota bacterium]|jgi:hypothetical protein